MSRSGSASSLYFFVESGEPFPVGDQRSAERFFQRRTLSEVLSQNAFVGDIPAWSWWLALHTKLANDTLRDNYR